MKNLKYASIKHQCPLSMIGLWPGHWLMVNRRAVFFITIPLKQFYLMKTKTFDPKGCKCPHPKKSANNVKAVKSSANAGSPTKKLEATLVNSWSLIATLILQFLTARSRVVRPPCLLEKNSATQNGLSSPQTRNHFFPMQIRVCVRPHHRAGSNLLIMNRVKRSEWKKDSHLPI